MSRINDCFTCCYYAWDFHLVCAVHPTGPENKTCDDFERDPETEAILYKDFLGVGEPVEQNGTINNPWHRDPEENWAPPGTKYVDGELVFVEEN
ncbi:MAG: hypothetical protein WBB43_17120 [Limnoraphis sp.]